MDLKTRVTKLEQSRPIVDREGEALDEALHEALAQAWNGEGSAYLDQVISEIDERRGMHLQRDLIKVYGGMQA